VYFLGYPLNFDLQRSALDPKLVVDTDIWEYPM